MNKEITKRACLSLMHCKICRTNNIARKACGFAEVCPYGYTKDILPDLNIEQPQETKSQIDYCPEFEKPCCSRKTGMCKLTKEKCITNGTIRCDRVKE